jgi:hypothetical protein
VTWRSAQLVVGEAEREKGDGRGGEASHPEDADGEHQEQEQVEQRPGCQPVAIDPVGTEHGQHPPARRQREADIEAVGIRGPAGCRERTGAFRAADRLELRAGGAKLHTGGPGCGIAGDQLPLTIDSHHFEPMVGGGVEPGNHPTLPPNRVFVGDAPAVLVEPESAADLEAVGLPQAAAGGLHDPAKRLSRVPAEHGQASPLLGKGREIHVHRRGVGKLCGPQVGPRLEGDEFLRYGRHGVGCIGDLSGVFRAKGVDANPPCAGADLSAKPPRSIDRHRNRCVNEGHLPAGRHARAKCLLPASSRDGQFHFGPQPERQSVFEHTVDLGRELVVLLLGRPRPPQPEQARCISIREPHLLPIAAERENADARRDRDSFRLHPPHESSADRMRARGHADRGHSVVGDDRHRLAVELHRVWPGVGIARERQPGFSEGLGGEFPFAVAICHVEPEGRRPERKPGGGIVVGGWASRIGDVAEHPGPPGLECGRNSIVSRETLRVASEGGDQRDAEAQNPRHRHTVGTQCETEIRPTLSLRDERRSMRPATQRDLRQNAAARPTATSPASVAGSGTAAMLAVGAAEK